MNFIFGSAGFAKEVDWLIHEIYAAKGCDYRSGYFVVEDGNEAVGKEINSRLVLSETEVFSKFSEQQTNYFIAIGNPDLREKIAQKIKKRNDACLFPNLIHPDVSLDCRPGKVNIGYGNIICAKTVLTTDINIGDFVHINLDCTVGHDTHISSFCTLSPGVHVSGNVTLGEKVFLGTGAVILEQISICPFSTVGASATVVKTIKAPGTYVGTPAHRIK